VDLSERVARGCIPKVLLLDFPLQVHEPRSAGGLVGGEEVTVAGVRPDRRASRPASARVAKPTRPASRCAAAMAGPAPKPSARVDQGGESKGHEPRAGEEAQAGQEGSRICQKVRAVLSCWRVSPQSQGGGVRLVAAQGDVLACGSGLHDGDSLGQRRVEVNAPLVTPPLPHEQCPEAPSRSSMAKSMALMLCAVLISRAVCVCVVAAAQQRRLERVHCGEGQDHPDPDHQQGTPNRHACRHACGPRASWAASPHASGVIPSMWTLRGGPCSRTRLVLAPCRSPGFGHKKRRPLFQRGPACQNTRRSGTQVCWPALRDLRLPLVIWLRGRCGHWGRWSRVRDAAAQPRFGDHRVCIQRVEHLHALDAGEDPCSVHQRLPATWNAAPVSASRSCAVAASSRSLDLGPAPGAQAVVQATEHTLLDQRQQPGQMLPEQAGVRSYGHGHASLSSIGVSGTCRRRTQAHRLCRTLRRMSVSTAMTRGSPAASARATRLCPCRTVEWLRPRTWPTWVAGSPASSRSRYMAI
jgi:hypothetical protein